MDPFKLITNLKKESTAHLILWLVTVCNIPELTQA